MKDDPHLEKRMPSVPSQYQQKYHKQRKEREEKKSQYEDKIKEYEKRWIDSGNNAIYIAKRRATK